MLKRLSPLIPAGLLVQQILPSPDHLTIVATARPKTAACPDCAALSGRVHSRYDRTLGDLPWQGRPVTLRVRVRRFRCLNPACLRRTFAERLGETARPAARRTSRLGDLQRHLGLVVGGEAGARLAARLAIPISPDTLLRMARRGDPSPGPRPPPRVLGVDDWAWRRGHRYGTVLVDLEQNRVLDLLPDRRAESLAAWLKRNPGVEIVARDRAGVYADGVRQGAPDAVQVADRWHLLRNLSDALQAIAGATTPPSRRIATAVAAAGRSRTTAVTPASRGRYAATTPRGPAAHAGRRARFEEAIRLHSAGGSHRQIARLLGTDCKTVRRWLRAGDIPSWRQPRRGSMLDAHRDHLERRWAEGCRNAARLWRELASVGFSVGYTTVQAWAARRRKAEPNVGPDVRRGQRTAVAMAIGPPCGPPADGRGRHAGRSRPSVRGAAAGGAPACCGGRGRTAAVPPSATTSSEALDDVLTAMSATPLAGFTAELRKDIDAVQAALDLPWTTNPVEGQIGRIKMLKRTMYGRAGFDLLRARVLHAA